MTFNDIITLSGMTNTQLADYFDIPLRTIQHWSAGDRDCPQYLLKLMEYKLNNEAK